MRIIHLVRATTWGGGEQYAKDLCEYSVKHGHEVTVVSRGAAAVDSHFTGIGVTPVKMPLGGLFDFVTPRRLASLICSLPEDKVVVHVHTFKDAELMAAAKRIIGRRRRVNLVCTRHLVKRGKGGLRWRRIYNAIDHLVFVSDLARREFMLGNPPVDTGKIEVVHNSIIAPAPLLQKPASFSHEEGRTTDDVTLLYTGRISEEKGVDVLIKALAQLRDERVRLKIAGTGREEYISRLKALATVAGVDGKLDWLGFVDNVFDEIAKADICVAPSKWREPFGLTIIEFMSQGKPVVTTSNGAQVEIITQGVDGELVDAGSPEALAAALRRLIRHPEKRVAMGERATATFANRFSYPVFYSKIERLYNDFK